MAKYQQEPIAVIGIGCRFPGGVASPAEFWDLLKDGRDGIVPVPADRWNIDEFYDPDPAAPGKMYVRAGGFLTHNIKEFDPAFFGMSPREAGFIDPQQRLLMEVAWEALEDAGLQPERLAGSDTGVYVGGFMLDNLLTQFSPLNREHIGPHTAVGSTLTILSNRLSYVFDFRGPSMTIDTACSSSLVAMHEACQAIWRGECGLALFGGVNVMHRPENLIAMCKGGFLSPDGRSKSFDIRANGYGRGEGAGIVVLKPYADALRDGDRIYGLVRGTGANQDGRTDGITVPNPHAQEELIRTVCAKSGVEPQQIRYVEAHGTGTPVGDPLEAGAIGAAIGQGRSAQERCVVGSVKANIGHLEAASGVAGLIKLALCLKNKAIPPLANLTTPNPKIPFDELGLRLPLQLEPMPSGPGPACVAINSFGYGGTNAHAILEEYVASDAAPDADGGVRGAAVPAAEPQWHVLPLSARSKPALEELARRYLELLADEGLALGDVCYSAALRRGHQDHRVALAGESREAMLSQLQEFIAGGIAAGHSPIKGQAPVFVLTGMGPQWWAMGRELLRTQPVLRRVAEECDAIFRRLAGWSILDEMEADEARSRMNETQIAQPANFVLQVGLAALLRAWGVEPAAVVGHSVGEVSAAYISGVLSLEDALLVSYHRSRIQKKAAGQGGMLAVGLSAHDAQPYLERHAGVLSLAAANGPNAVTLAGDDKVLAEIAAQLTEQRIFNRALAVEVAYHSHTMEPLKPELLDALKCIKTRPATVPLYSTVTGDIAQEGVFGAEYWCDNIREPVYFEKAMRALLRDGHRLFLEVGPHPVLSSSIAECCAAQGVQAVQLACLRRGKPELPTLFAAFSALYGAGGKIDWQTYHAAGGRYVALPSYPWQREEHWNEGQTAHLDRLGEGRRALLGRKTEAPHPVWESTLNANRLPYLADHKVEGLVVLPGAAYVEAGLELLAELTDAADVLCLEHLEFDKALIIGAAAQPRFHVSYDAGSRRYDIFSRDSEKQPWNHHARGYLSFVAPGAPEKRRLDAIEARCQVAVDHDDHYADMHRRGLQYGPYFQGVRTLRLREDGMEAIARIEGHAQLGAERPALLHPSLLDACFQALLAGLRLRNDPNVYVPVEIAQVRFHRAPPDAFWCHAELIAHGNDRLEGSVTLCDDDGEMLVEVLGVRAQALSKKNRDDMADAEQWLYRFDWERQDLAGTPEDGGRWLLLGDAGCQALAAQLFKHGASTVVVAQAGKAFERLRASAYSLRLDDADDLRRLFAAIDAPSLRGIVHMESLNLAGMPADAGAANVVTALRLVQEAAALEGAQAQLFFVTGAAQPLACDGTELAVAQSPLCGFVRVAINEFPDLRLRAIDVDPKRMEVDGEGVAQLCAELLMPSREEEVALRADGRHALRLVRAASGAMQPADGTVTLPQRRLAPHEVEVAIETVALENDGGAIVSGVVARIGTEAAGLTPGECVMFRAEAGTVAALEAFAVLPQDAIWRSRALAEAIASGGEPAQLLNLCAASYALHDLGRVREGDWVLIHHAAAPLGLAAVQLAQRAGAVVCATVAGAAERDALRGLGVDHVFDCASLEFADRIVQLTAGRGVDIVINDCEGELAQKSFALLAPFGRFVATRGAASVAEAGRGLDLGRLLANLDLGQLVRHAALFETLAQRIGMLFADGTLQDLPQQRHVLADASGLAQALQDLAQQPAIGLKLVDLGDPATRIEAARSGAGRRFSAEASYLITGGLGGFGLQMATWLAEQGVRNLVLVGRSGATSDEARETVSRLRAEGVAVAVEALDIADEAAVAGLIEKIGSAMPPLKGVFHAAAVLDDAAIRVLEAQKIHTVMNPKARGAWLLHRFTEGLELDYFVLFSSVGSLVGNPGQSPYVSANAFLDALAHHRHAKGLPATAINWGALGQVGMAARHKGVEDYLNRMGFGSFTPRQAIGMLDRILSWKPVAVGAAMMNWQTLAVSYPDWTRGGRNTHVFASALAGPAETAEDAALAALKGMAPEERRAAIGEIFFDTVAAVLRVTRAKIAPEQSLLGMGMDSMMGIELQGAIERNLGVKLSTLELMKGNSLGELTAQLDSLMAARSEPSGARGAAAPSASASSVSAEDILLKEVKDLDKLLSGMSEAEIDSALEKILTKEVGA